MRTKGSKHATSSKESLMSTSSGPKRRTWSRSKPTRRRCWTKLRQRGSNYMLSTTWSSTSLIWSLACQHSSRSGSSAFVATRSPRLEEPASHALREPSTSTKKAKRSLRETWTSKIWLTWLRAIASWNKSSSTRTSYCSSTSNGKICFCLSRKVAQRKLLTI